MSRARPQPYAATRVAAARPRRSILRPTSPSRFDPAWTLSDLSRQQLADLGRETLLHGHLQDRVGLPTVMARFGEDVMTAVSIDEWMAASPIYSQRTQRRFGFEGDDVGVIFKNLQLDIGAPHQFMDFRYRLERPDYGEFWLHSCGALLDVAPFGEARVKRMCHDVEDPTFDATAAATNRRARIRPIHRPPPVPDSGPHCRWKVFIDPAAEPVPDSRQLAAVAASRIARIEVVPPSAAAAEPGGWTDYAGAFDPDFQLEDLSHAALVIANQEFAVQSHLLARAFLLCVRERCGDEAVAPTARAQWTGIAGLTAARLRAAFCGDLAGVEAIARVFQLHPVFQPRSYVDLRVEIPEPDRVRVALHPCPALEEGDGNTWFAELGPEPPPALRAIAWAANPRAVVRVASAAGAVHAWDVTIDADADPAEEPREVRLARLSGGASIRFERRRPLRV